MPWFVISFKSDPVSWSEWVTIDVSQNCSVPVTSGVLDCNMNYSLKPETKPV